MAKTKEKKVAAEITEAEAAPPPTLVRAARLDETGVFLGIDELPEAELTPLHLREIAECDLPPERYRWSKEHARFEPIPKRRPEDALKDPDAVRAIALGFLALHSQSIALPRETLDWVSKYARSFDSKGEVK